MKTKFTLLLLLFVNFLFAQNCPSNTTSPKALIAGDSWAQYMWDDGTHNKFLDKFGQADKDLISQSLGADPGPGHTGSEYAISGSEARQWADQTNYPWISNVISEINNNPTIETVILSIGGNDILAGRSEGGWYQNMDNDVPGAEAALFSTIKDNTFSIIDGILASHPNTDILLSSYDYPSFTMSAFNCLFYACAKRTDLSYPGDPEITDAELNQMMITVETERISWLPEETKLFFDNSIGLTHYYYGNGVDAPGATNLPEQQAPFSNAFFGGNPAYQSLRSNFRNGFDPIHLNAETYEYKVTHQIMNYFLPKYRSDVTTTLFSNGSNQDGWTDGTTTGTGAVRIGDFNNSRSYKGILSFDTSTIPSDATISTVSLYLIRNNISNENPFTSGLLGMPMIDVKSGEFGNIAIENSDYSEVADVVDAGCFHGTVSDNGYALRIDLNAAGFAALNKNGNTQFRIYFPNNNTNADYIDFNTGTSTLDSDLRTVCLAEYMGDARPFLDITYSIPVPVELISFTARAENNKNVMLNWSSAIEDNFLGYEIQHSKDYMNWNKIGFKNASGAGNYSMLHSNPLNGNNYYRLKMIDHDQSFEYSDVRIVNIKDHKFTINVYPNPFNQQIHIKGLQNEKVDLLIYDTMGRIIYNRSFEAGFIQQDFIIQMNENLASGIYMLHVNSENETSVIRLNKL